MANKSPYLSPLMISKGTLGTNSSPGPHGELCLYKCLCDTTWWKSCWCCTAPTSPPIGSCSDSSSSLAVSHSMISCSDSCSFPPLSEKASRRTLETPYAFTMQLNIMLLWPWHNIQDNIRLMNTGLYKLQIMQLLYIYLYELFWQDYNIFHSPGREHCEESLLQ